MTDHCNGGEREGRVKYSLSGGSVTNYGVPDWSSVCLEGVYQRMPLSIHIPHLQLLLALGDKDRIYYTKSVIYS